MDHVTLPPPRAVLGRAAKSAYAVGHVLNDLAAAVWFSFMLVVFTNVQQLSKSQAGVLMLVGQVRRTEICATRRAARKLSPLASPPPGPATTQPFWLRSLRAPAWGAGPAPRPPQQPFVAAVARRTRPKHTTACALTQPPPPPRWLTPWPPPWSASCRTARAAPGAAGDPGTWAAAWRCSSPSRA